MRNPLNSMNSKIDELKPLLRLAAPIAFSHMANYFMQIVDTLFVGALGAVALGGVALGSGLFAIIMMIAIGILLGLDYRVSHAYGAKKLLRIARRYLVQGFYLAVILAVPMMHLSAVFRPPFRSFRNCSRIWRASRRLSENAFVQPSSLPAFHRLPPISAGNRDGRADSGRFSRREYSERASATGFSSTGIWAFPAMGVAGSGLATTISSTVMLVALFTYTMARNRKMGFSLRRAGMRFQSKLGARSSLARPPGLGTTSSRSRRFRHRDFHDRTPRRGSTRRPPDRASDRELHLHDADGNLRRERRDRRTGPRSASTGARRSGKAGWESRSGRSGHGLLRTRDVPVFATPILHTFTHEHSVIAIARQLILMAAFFQIFDGAQVVATGTLRGAGNTRASILANLVGHWFIGLPIGLALCFWMHWNALGIWAGLIIGLATVAVILLTVWRRFARTSWRIRPPFRRRFRPP